MERLNYHHLLYFFTVAHEGSVARASVRLGLAQPTVSAQIHALEQKLGRKLLERRGRGLKVTPAGETVMRYADSIFALGGELLTALDVHGLAGNGLAGNASLAPVLAVGISSALPPALAAMLMPALFALQPRPLLTLVEAPPEALAAQLAARSLHFVLTDAPPPTGMGLHSRVLLETPIALFAPPALARKLRKDFPANLASAPVLISPAGPLRREVEHWLAQCKPPVKLLAGAPVRMQAAVLAGVLAEAPHPESLALAAGAAVFAPWLLRDSLKSTHGLLPVAELTGTRWRVFAITAGRGVKHPALDAVVALARSLH